MSETRGPQSLWSSLIRFGFRLLYNELAWTYDLVSWVVSLGDWRAWQRAALPFVHGPRVLEIAHGPGHMLLALNAAGHRVMGLDLSPYMGRQAQRRLSRAGVSLPLVRGSALELPLADGSFDTVLSTFPTEFIVDPRTLAAVRRVLAENGRFIIVPEGHMTGRSPVHRLIEWLYAVTGQRGGPFAVDESGHWPSDSMLAPFIERFRKAGFTLTFQRVTLPRSAATVVIATRDGERPLAVAMSPDSS